MFRDVDRDKALVAMLAEGGSLETCASVIVYCTRRDECERLAVLIRSGVSGPGLMTDAFVQNTNTGEGNHFREVKVELHF